MSAVVEVRDVVRRFGDVTALNGISFNVDPGELFGLVGPDGSGKTTLFRILATLMLPDSGHATVLGRDVVREFWDVRARLGYMPGTFSLYPDLSVAENLSFFASVFGTTVQRGYDLIAPVYRQLEPFRDRRADALSGGMKQKLALSCALVHRPELLLLDEPTTGVDAVSRREFWEQLRALRDSGLPIIVSTPYMDEAMQCDRVALVQRGRILDIDRPGDLARRFPYPLLAVAAGGQRRHELLHALRAFPHARAVYPFGETMHYVDARQGRPADAIAPELHAHLERAGHAGAAASPVAPTIEDTFMALLAREDAGSAAA